jgi:hypothetical protein
MKYVRPDTTDEVTWSPEFGNGILFNVLPALTMD